MLLEIKQAIKKLAYADMYTSDEFMPEKESRKQYEDAGHLFIKLKKNKANLKLNN